MLGAADIAWGFLKQLPWKWIGCALAVAAAIYAIDSRGYGRGRHSRDADVSALSDTIANLKAASQKASDDNKANVKRINDLQDQVTKDQENDYPQKLADARSALAAYVRLHPAAPGDLGIPGQPEASGIPDAAGQSDAAPAQAIVSVLDLDACAQSWVTATGLQRWIEAQAGISR